MKDAKGHGSNARTANSVDATFSSKAGVGGLGKGMYARLASGEQYKLNAAATGGMVPRVGSEIDPAQHTKVIAEQHGIPTAHLAPGGRFGYNPQAVNNAIASSNRAGRRIGGREASMIHRLLKGRG